MTLRFALMIIAAGLVSSFGPLAPWAHAAPAEAPPVPDDGIFAEIETPRGLIVAKLFYEKMPLTVTSFVGLAEGKLGPEPRKPYFDGLTFHRVAPEFVIQGGDPTGTGMGGPGYRFPDEFAAGLRHDKPGVLSMANTGPDTNGSQFFITLGPARHLDFVHAIFGEVVSGLEILPQIQRGDTMKVKIVRRGAAAQRFETDEAAFAARLARAPRTRHPHVVDHTGLAAAGESTQARYLETRLSNLARFTGRQIYVRLFPTFEPETPGQTPQQFADEHFAALHLPPEAILACYFAIEDQWLLASGRKDLTLPTIELPPPQRVTTAEAFARMRQSRIYSAAGQVVSGLIDQTDPK